MTDVTAVIGANPSAAPVSLTSPLLVGNISVSYFWSEIGTGTIKLDGPKVLASSR